MNIDATSMGRSNGEPVSHLGTREVRKGLSNTVPFNNKLDWTDKTGEGVVQTVCHHEH